jgi:hypothetical protein
MRKQNARDKQAAKTSKSKTTNARLSKQSPSTDEIVRALQVKKQMDQIDKVETELQKKDPAEKDELIVLSDTWYEFSVFWRKFNIYSGTADSWLKKGWLAYSEVGKMRFINKTDIEEMMMHFRRPSIWAALFFMLLNNVPDLLMM